jgi:hypothetical protein
METFYTILRVDGSSERLSVDWPRDPEYEQIRALVEPILGGAMMEHVYILGDKGEPQDMFVDEIGHWKNLSVNHEATRLYRRATLLRRPEVSPEELNYIVGAAVVFDRIIWT